MAKHLCSQERQHTHFLRSEDYSDSFQWVRRAGDVQYACRGINTPFHACLHGLQWWHCVGSFQCRSVFLPEGKDQNHNSSTLYASSSRPFLFKKDAHHCFLAHVIAYRRSHVKVTQDNLTRIQALGLLNPCAIIQNNGTAVGKFAFLIW